VIKEKNMQLILDFGSGNTCLNKMFKVKEMIDELEKIDVHKHGVIIKWQLFKEAGNNIPLLHKVFDFAYKYAKILGYQTTASVFDKESLDFLLQYDVPMIKIANNRNLDYLIGEAPRKIPIYISVDNVLDRHIIYNNIENVKILACVSNYPATKEDYQNHFGHYLNSDIWFDGISDHTSDWFLFKDYQPEILEVHYKLPDSQGLDAGSFSRTPSMLKEIL